MDPIFIYPFVAGIGEGMWCGAPWRHQNKESFSTWVTIPWKLNLICKKNESWSLERRRRGGGGGGGVGGGRRRIRALFPLLGFLWLETAHLLLQKHHSSSSTIAKWVIFFIQILFSGSFCLIICKLSKELINYQLNKQGWDQLYMHSFQFL